MRADLHLHTWISDGDVAPSQTVALAARARLDVIAVTDHDTAAGVGEAVLAAEGLRIVVIPGIEISTRTGDQELHILGYWIDPESPPILEHQRRAVRRRAERMIAMVEKLQRMGISIAFEDVERAAGPEVRTLGRPHLARALFALGHTRYYGEAFLRFIGDAGPAFVAEGFPPPEYAIDTIHAAGGLAVLAHPPLNTYTQLLPSLISHGLDGIECYRPGIAPAELGLLEAAARLHGLLLTGGSDWHGPQRSTLGEFSVDAHRIPEILEFGGLIR